jgi:hypothetical protein
MDMGLDTLVCNGSNCSSCRSSDTSREDRSKEEKGLDMILQYTNDAIVDRFKRKLNLNDEKATELFNDVKTFLWLQSVAGPLSPTPMIDKGWHEFILYTEDYAAFCQEYFGYFIHHRPHRPGEMSEERNVATRDRLFLEAVEHLDDTKLSDNWNWDSRVNAECTPVPVCSSKPD